MFHFVYQRGDFYSDSLTIGWIQYAGIAMPILLFVITKVYESWRKRRDEERRLKNTRAYYLLLLKEITNPIDRQINIIENFVDEQLNRLHLSRSRLTNVTSLNTDEIMSLNGHDLFKSMITERDENSEKHQKEIHHYCMLKSHVRLVSMLKKELEARLNELIARSNVHVAELKLYIDKIEQEKREVWWSDAKDAVSKEFIFSLSELQRISNESNVGGQDLEVIQNSYLKPLMSLCNGYVSKCRVAADVLQHARICDSHINELRKVAKQHQEEFMLVASKLKQSSRQITESVAYFTPPA